MKNRLRGTRHALAIFAAGLAVLALLPAVRTMAADGYCAVVSKATLADAAWKPVVEALRQRHHGTLIVYDKTVDESLVGLRKELPRYACFVAKPDEAGRDFVAHVNRLTRRLNDDPYGDCLWGILTGYDASAALRIARQSTPLVIHRAAAATDIALDACDEGVCYNELRQGQMVRKTRGGKPQPGRAPADTTKALVDALNVEHADLFVTSGHASERNWQIGYSYRNGQFLCQHGQLFGVDTRGQRFPVRSENPKVYLAVGNCLMGHVDGPEAMALAWMNSAGVDQMAGYTVTSWYGYAGWGLLDYFVEQPGRFTLAEAFFANQQALLHRLKTYFPGIGEFPGADKEESAGPAALSARARQAGLTLSDFQGLFHDRDTLAFYGDPAWEVRMAPGPLAWEQSLVEKDGQYRFEIRPRQGAQSFTPPNTNGSQRGGRPIVQLFPRRIRAENVRILEGAELEPVVTDNFLLVPLPKAADPKRTYRVVFRLQ